MIISKQKHILFVNGHMKVGGGEKSLLDLLQHIDYSRYDVDLLLLEGKGEYFEFIPPQVNVIYRNITPAFGPLVKTIWLNLRDMQISILFFRIIILLSRIAGKRLFCLSRQIFQMGNCYDYAVAYRPGMCADIVAYVARADYKICWWHNGKCDYTTNQIAEVASTWKYLDKIVSVSEGCKQLIIDNFSLPSGKIAVVPNMIDVKKVQINAGNFSPYIDEAKIRIVTLCRLSPEKHLDNIIFVMSHLEAVKEMGIKWYIIGDGPERDYLYSLVENSHMRESIVFLGQQLNPYPYIKYADFYVNTSYQESQSLSVLEAMALNTPCVVTRTIGTEGYCINGENCFVAEQSRESLLQSIKIIISSDDCKEMVENAYKMVLSNFSSESIMNKIYNLIS